MNQEPKLNGLVEMYKKGMVFYETLLFKKGKNLGTIQIIVLVAKC